MFRRPLCLPQVEKECSDYDSAMMKAVVLFCKTKGVDVEESALRQELGNIRLRRLKDDSGVREQMLLFLGFTQPTTRTRLCVFRGVRG